MLEGGFWVVTLDTDVLEGEIGVVTLDTDEVAFSTLFSTCFLVKRRAVFRPEAKPLYEGSYAIISFTSNFIIDHFTDTKLPYRELLLVSLQALFTTYDLLLRDEEWKH